MMIEELLQPAELEKLVRDSFANYVIQTAVSSILSNLESELAWPLCQHCSSSSCIDYLGANSLQMDYADPETRAHLIENMRPFLHLIRGTPYGRRIFGKIQDHEGRLSGSSSGQVTPQDVSSPVSASGAMSGNPYATRPQGYNLVANGYGGIASPQPHRMSNPPFPAFQAAMNQGYAQFTQHQPDGRYS